MPSDNFAVKTWLDQIGKSRRKIFIKKLKNYLEERGLTQQEVYKGLLQLIATSPYVRLTRSNTLVSSQRRSANLDHQKDSIVRDKGSSEKIDECVSPKAKCSKPETETPELLDERVGNSAFVVRIPRTAITLNLNSYMSVSSKKNLSPSRTSPEIRIADSSVPDVTPLIDNNHNTIKKNDSIIIGKKPKIIEDVTCIEGMILTTTTLKKSVKDSNLQSKISTIEKIKIIDKTKINNISIDKITKNSAGTKKRKKSSRKETQNVIITTKEERIQEKFRTLFGNEATLTESDEEQKLISKLSSRKRRKESRMSSDSGVCLTEITSDSMMSEIHDKLDDEINFKREKQKTIFYEKFVKSMPSLDSANIETSNTIINSQKELPDSSTNLEEKSLIRPDSSSHDRITIADTPLNKNDSDVCDPLNSEVGLSNEAQISTPTSTTACLPIETSTKIDASFEDLKTLIDMDLKTGCHINMQGNRISIQENSTAIDEDTMSCYNDDENRLIIDERSCSDFETERSSRQEESSKDDNPKIVVNISNIEEISRETALHRDLFVPQSFNVDEMILPNDLDAYLVSKNIEKAPLSLNEKIPIELPNGMENYKNGTIDENQNSTNVKITNFGMKTNYKETSILNVILPKNLPVLSSADKAVSNSSTETTSSTNVELDVDNLFEKLTSDMAQIASASERERKNENLKDIESIPREPIISTVDEIKGPRTLSEVLPDSELPLLLVEPQKSKEIPKMSTFRVLHPTELGARWCPTPLDANVPNQTQLQHSLNPSVVPSTNRFGIQNSSNPLVIQNSSVPLVIQNSSVPLVVQNSSIPLVVQNFSNPSMTQNSSNPLMTQNSSNPLMTQNSSNSLMAQNPSNPLMTQNSSNPLVTQNSSNPLMTQNSLNPLMAHIVSNSAMVQSPNQQNNANQLPLPTHQIQVPSRSSYSISQIGQNLPTGSTRGCQLPPYSSIPQNHPQRPPGVMMRVPAPTTLDHLHQMVNTTLPTQEVQDLSSKISTVRLPDRRPPPNYIGNAAPNNHYIRPTVNHRQQSSTTSLPSNSYQINNGSSVVIQPSILSKICDLLVSLSWRLERLERLDKEREMYKIFQLKKDYNDKVELLIPELDEYAKIIGTRDRRIIVNSIIRYYEELIEPGQRSLDINKVVKIFNKEHLLQPMIPSQSSVRPLFTELQYQTLSRQIAIFRQISCVLYYQLVAQNEAAMEVERLKKLEAAKTKRVRRKRTPAVQEHLNVTPINAVPSAIERINYQQTIDSTIERILREDTVESNNIQTNVNEGIANEHNIRINSNDETGRDKSHENTVAENVGEGFRHHPILESIRDNNIESNVRNQDKTMESNFQSKTIETSIPDKNVESNIQKKVIETNVRNQSYNKVIDTNINVQIFEKEQFASSDSVSERSFSSIEDGNTSVLDVLIELDVLDSMAKGGGSKISKSRRKVEASVLKESKKCSKETEIRDPEVSPQPVLNPVPATENSVSPKTETSKDLTSDSKPVESVETNSGSSVIVSAIEEVVEKNDETSTKVPEISEVVESNNESTNEIPVITLDDEDNLDAVSMESTPMQLSADRIEMDSFNILEVKSISKDLFNKMGGVIDETASVDQTGNKLANDEDSNCFNCGEQSTLACERCRAAFYCSTNCHQKHWSVIHHIECKLALTES